MVLKKVNVMGELKVGTIAMVYGLVMDLSHNGSCVTLVQLIPPYSEGSRIGQYICPVTGQLEEYLKDSNYWWLCDDGYLYLPKNLLPIGDKDTDLVKNKEKEHEH